jgi:hypothetical protein
MTKAITPKELPPFVAATFIPEPTKVARAVLLAICVLGLSLVAKAHEPIFITFDPPGSQGTFPQCINEAGAIPGYYHDQNNIYHGFLRVPDGKIITFDVPSEGTGPGLGPSPYAINREGMIAGAYFDASGESHGFVRTPGGQITTFDVPGQGPTGSFPSGINDFGVIAGTYIDTDNVQHGFLRFPWGAITTFDAPGAGTEAGQGTYTGTCAVINLEGAIAGTYIDASNVSHGFVRALDGKITSFDAPGAGTAAGTPNCGFFNGACQGTYVSGISLAGAVTGWDNDADFFAHGFARSRHGTITTFDAPGANHPGQYSGTQPEGINAEGWIVGNYNTDYFDHGFLRAPDGSITVFDAPGAVNTGPYTGTQPGVSNSGGEITGLYTDATGVAHGFLRTTKCHDGNECGNSQ